MTRNPKTFPVFLMILASKREEKDKSLIKLSRVETVYSAVLPDIHPPCILAIRTLRHLRHQRRRSLLHLDSISQSHLSLCHRISLTPQTLKFHWTQRRCCFKSAWLKENHNQRHQRTYKATSLAWQGNYDVFDLFMVLKRFAAVCFQHSCQY